MCAIKQTDFSFPNNWGGRRKGAGRKPKNGRAGVSHRTRAPLASRYPVHVTMRLRAGLPKLRRKRTYKVIFGALRAGRDKGDFRLIHYSVQQNHLHLIVEAKNRTRLSRGVQGLSIRTARALNRLWHRTGRVFADRYHDHILRTPREVRNALAYVLRNAAHHKDLSIHGKPDPYSSGPSFEGWQRAPRIEHTLPHIDAVARPRTWLARIGWHRHGLISLNEIPS